VSLGPEEMREEALRLAGAVNGVSCLMGTEEGKVSIIVAVAKPRTDIFDANSILHELLPLVSGKGGGRQHLARGGGPNVNGASDVIAQLPLILEKRIRASVLKNRYQQMP